MPNSPFLERQGLAPSDPVFLSTAAENRCNLGVHRSQEREWYTAQELQRPGNLPQAHAQGLCCPARTSLLPFLLHALALIARAGFLRRLIACIPLAGRGRGRSGPESVPWHVFRIRSRAGYLSTLSSKRPPTCLAFPFGWRSSPCGGGREGAQSSNAQGSNSKCQL